MAKFNVSKRLQLHLELEALYMSFPTVPLTWVVLLVLITAACNDAGVNQYILGIWMAINVIVSLYWQLKFQTYIKNKIDMIKAELQSLKDTVKGEVNG